MSALEAARLGDQIGHTDAMSWLLKGIVVGFVATGALLFLAGATVATGGAAAVVVGSLIAGAAGGGLAGMSIGATSDLSPKGPILSGSPDTFLGAGMKPAARAVLDKVDCDDHSEKRVAQGSETVFVNGVAASRRTDGTECSGKIMEGQLDVFFGGPVGTYLDMEPEVPGWLVTTLTIAMWTGAAIATGGAVAMVGWAAGLSGAGLSIVGGLVGGKIGGAIGRSINGERGAAIGEVIGGFGGSILGGVGAGRLFGARPPNTSRVKYGPDSRYQKADGSWDWPPNDGFAARMNDTIPVGSRVDRFGSPRGSYLAPEETPFSQRALAPSSLTEPYYAYRVAKPLPVEAGPAAPAFDQPGAGIQYKTVPLEPNAPPGTRGPNVETLIKEGYLVPIELPVGPVIPAGVDTSGQSPPRPPR